MQSTYLTIHSKVLISRKKKLIFCLYLKEEKILQRNVLSHSNAFYIIRNDNTGSVTCTEILSSMQIVT